MEYPCGGYSNECWVLVTNDDEYLSSFWAYFTSVWSNKVQRPAVTGQGVSHWRSTQDSNMAHWLPMAGRGKWKSIKTARKLPLATHLPSCGRTPPAPCQLPNRPHGINISCLRTEHHASLNLMSYITIDKVNTWVVYGLYFRSQSWSMHFACISGTALSYTGQAPQIIWPSETAAFTPVNTQRRLQQGSRSINQWARHPLTLVGSSIVYLRFHPAPGGSNAECHWPVTEFAAPFS